MSGMIVAPQPIAVEEGAKVLMAGGNAVDAAVTCAFVQGVVSPQMCGVGGYIILNLHKADTSDPSHILDAPALAGSKVTPDMWQDIYLRPNPDGWGYILEGGVNTVGYQSVCIPGAVKGLHEALKKWGTISWGEALEPAIRIARDGFVVSSVLASGWASEAQYLESFSLVDCIKSNPEASRIYLKEDGSPYAAGEHLRNPDYSKTLKWLASRGMEDFYSGELAGNITQDLESMGGWITKSDLANYEHREEQPVVGTYRGYTIKTSQPPHGGPTLIAILNILEGYELSALEHNSPEYIYRVSMAMKAAFADRNPFLGDPRFIDLPLSWMISKERAAEWRDVIDSDNPIDVVFTPSEPPDTTHVNAVDGEGNCVSLTHSLGSSSGVITPGLGFMYNNSMVNFHPIPGHPNSITPGKGRTTGMTPTIVYKDDAPVLIIGAPGATRIVTSLVQVIVNMIDFGMRVSDAVLAPRFDCQGDLIKAQARIPEYICEDVRQRYPIERLAQSHGGLALVHAIAIDPETGRLEGAADTGAGGMALGV